MPLGCRGRNLVVCRSWERAFATSTFGTPHGVGCHSVGRDDVKRLRDLERENATPEWLLADAVVGERRARGDREWNLQARAPGGQPFVTCSACSEAGQSIRRECNAFGAKKGFECHSAADRKITAAGAVLSCRDGCVESINSRIATSAVDRFTGAGTATGRRRTDPYSVTRLRAAWASRSAGTRISPCSRRRGAAAPRPAPPDIGTPLRIPFDGGAIGRAALASRASSISVGAAPCQLAGTDSRPRALASPKLADTLLAVNGAPLTPAVPPMAGSTATGFGINPSPCSSAVA